MSEQVWWYATRAAGLMTWTTATASVVIGLMLSTRAVKARTGPWFLDLHRFLGGISVVFLIAHMATLWADSYVEFGVRELFIPGASEWKPEAIAWGIVGAYLLFAVEVSSLIRARLSNKVWRVIHFSSFAAMIAGSYHAYTAGSDVDNPVTWVIAGIGSLLVLGLVSMRMQRQDPDEVGGDRLSDNRAILEEMRQRLADLPIPESTPQPQLTGAGASTLPRRAPLSSDLPGLDAGAAEGGPGAVGFTDDPFTGVPANESTEPAIGDWATPSSNDPFAGAAPAESTFVQPADSPFADTAPPTAPAPTPPPPADPQPSTANPYAELAPQEPAPNPYAELAPQPGYDDPSPTGEPGAHGGPSIDPFRQNEPGPDSLNADEPAGRFRTRPFTDRAQDEVDLFEDLANDPVRAPGLEPLPDEPVPAPPSQTTTAATELFSAALPSDPAFDFSANPFPPSDPPPAAIHAPVEAAPQPAPQPTPPAAAAPAPAPMATPAPPPLPDAVDPETGEPDQAAYTAWLSEWLTFAEKYGDETPDDPNRAI